MTPETLSERFLEFPSGVRLGSPKPYNLRHLRLPEQSRILSLLIRLGRFLFQNWFRRGPFKAVVMEFPAVLRAFLKVVVKWCDVAKRPIEPEKKNRKKNQSNEKVTKGDFGRRPESNKKVTEKVACPCFVTF